MTAVGMLHVLRRRWLAALLGLLLTLGAAAYVKTTPTTVWYTRFEVILNSPAEDGKGNRNSRVLGNVSTDAVATAYLIVARVNNSNPKPYVSSIEATLYGAGYLNDTRARVQNIGNQWFSNVPAPTILVEITRPTEQEANAAVTQEVQALQNALTAEQDRLKVDTESRITMQVAPTQPAVGRVDSKPSRAVIGIVLFGFSLTAIACYWLDRWLLARKPRRALSDGPGTRPASTEARR